MELRSQWCLLTLVILVAVLGFGCQSNGIAAPSSTPSAIGEAVTQQGPLIKEAHFSCGPFRAYLREHQPNILLWTHDGSHLVFSHGVDFYHGGAVWIVDEQGTELRMVLDAKAVYNTEFSFADFLYGFYADLSPDGARLAYTSCQFPTEYDDSGQAQAVITQDGPEWYERTKHSYDIALAELDGGNQQRVTHTRLDDEHYPVWSPAGDRIAFMRASGPYNGRLYTMAPDGSDVQSVTAIRDMHVALVPPDWSPDGQRLALVVNEGRGHAREQRNVYTVRPDGSELTKVGEMGPLRFAYGSLTAAPTWSPDGERLAFAGFNGEELAIYTVRFDGSDLGPVWQGNSDTGPKAVSQVSWSPDGSELLIVGDGVYSAHLDSGNLRQLAGRIQRFTTAAWSPDGSRIAIYNPSSGTFLSVINRDGTNSRTLVHEEDDGNLVAANPEDEENP